VGTRLLARLEGRGVPLVAVLRPGRDGSAFEARGIEVRPADLDTGAGVSQALAAVHTLVHLAGLRQSPWLVPACENAHVARGIFLTAVHSRLPSAHV